MPAKSKFYGDVFMGIINFDIPELFGSDTEISLRNLSELEERLSKTIEERIAHINELSHTVVKDGEDADVIKSIILSLKPEDHADSDNIAPFNKKSIRSVFRSISLYERLFICEGISECYISGEKISYDMFMPSYPSFDTPKSASDRIAYLKNSYNDDAYMHLSYLLESPRAAYFDSITAVCEAVFNGNCEYCILPLETSSDGKLSSFYDLILKYSFKICAVYDLQDKEKKKYTRYGLISLQSDNNSSLSKNRSKVKYLEFTFESDGYPTLSDILSASEHCSMKLWRIDTLCPASSKGQRSPMICPVFRVDSADINTFLTYLAIDCQKFKPLGIYTQV